MATLPNFVAIQHADRADAEFRAWAQERARAYSHGVRARRAYVVRLRLVMAAVVAVVASGLFAAWQLATVITWLLNN